jgi:hypothetical protein
MCQVLRTLNIFLIPSIIIGYCCKKCVTVLLDTTMSASNTTYNNGVKCVTTNSKVSNNSSTKVRYNPVGRASNTTSLGNSFEYLTDSSSPTNSTKKKNRRDHKDNFVFMNKIYLMRRRSAFILTAVSILFGICHLPMHSLNIYK